MLRGMLLALGVVLLSSCTDNNSCPCYSNNVGSSGGYPLVANEATYTEGTCPNGLSCLVLTVSDSVGACALQVADHSSNAFYRNSTFAVFELYAPSGVPTPIPSGVYPVTSGSPGGASAAVVTFYKLDVACTAALSSTAVSGTVTLSGQQTVTITYDVTFSPGTLQATVVAPSCDIVGDTGASDCS